jgi:hypothetical protein
MSSEIEALRVRWQAALAWRGPCPQCHSERVWHDGIRYRKATLLVEDQVEHVADVPVRRLRCAPCSHRWTYPPAGISSRAHYQSCVVSHAVAAFAAPQARPSTVADAHHCNRSTIGRWVARVAALVEPAKLAHTLIREAGQPVLPPPLTPTAHGLVARALEVLGLLEALGSLRGLEPPALAHLTELLPAFAPPTALRALAPCGA